MFRFVSAADISRLSRIPEIPQSSKFSRFILIFPKVLIEFTEFSYSVLNIFVIIVQDFKPAISYVRNQEATCERQDL